MSGSMRKCIYRYNNNIVMWLLTMEVVGIEILAIEGSPPEVCLPEQKLLYL
jgi:hypothetical protein